MKLKNGVVDETPRKRYPLPPRDLIKQTPVILTIESSPGEDPSNKIIEDLIDRQPKADIKRKIKKEEKRQLKESSKSLSIWEIGDEKPDEPSTTDSGS
jgi:hypothetical protein